MSKLQSPTQAMLEIPFTLDSISEAPAPDGSEGAWQRYIIKQGSNTITGLRAGTRTEVSLQLEGMIERLNERYGKQQAKLRR